MKSSNVSGIKVAILVAVIMGIVFAIFGGLSEGFHLQSLGILFFCGFLIGAMAAPELEPKAFRFPTVWRITTCTLGFIVGAIYLKASLENIALAAFVGAILGYLAPYWIKHFPIP
jgi:hypothetical protein